MSSNDIESLQKEINELRSKINSNNLIERSIKIFATVATLATILIGVFNYTDKKEEEFRKEFWEKRFSFYEEVTGLAAAIAIADNLDSVKNERKQFWKLYWGKLSMIEDRAVFDAMVEFGKDLRNQENVQDSTSRLLQLSYSLARACRNSLKETWEPVLLDDLDKNKH